MGAESFTLLAILEARDRASEYIAKVDESLGRLGATSKAAADEVYASGVKIDEALGRDVSAADRLDTASARVAAANAQAAQSAQALTAAENELRDAQASAAAGATDDAEAQARLIAASRTLSGAQKDAAASAAAVKDAQASEGAALRASADAGDENAAAQLRSRDASDESAAGLGGIGKAAGITALGLGIAAGVMVKAAGNFQDSTTHLQTDAGVSAKNLAMVQAGILQVSTATGQSAGDITNAMYHIASSGYTAANGLAILKTAAEGARVGGADLDTTSKALVGTLTAYYGSSLSAAQATKDSTSLMNQLIATVSVGDMRMQDLASSLSAVTPVAAAAHVSFAQVGGAIATMTSQGMSAQQATQDLANAMRNMLHPNAAAAQEMRALGLNANTVSQNLGKQGITGTLQEFTNAIVSNTQGGSVMVGYMKEMTPQAQGLARAILSGSISTKALRTAVYGLNPQQAKLISLFDTAATSATGLKQTYTGAMATLTGGATGLNVALMLSGKHMSDFSANVAKIAAEARKGGTSVDNWATIQSTFAFKTSQAKTAVENTGIAIGSALLPAVTSVVTAVGKVLVPVAEWTAKHQRLTAILFVGVTALAATVAALVLAGKAVKAVGNAASELGKAYKGAIAVLQKLGILSKKTAGQQEADAKKTAAANEQASADSVAAAETSAGEQEAASGEAAAAAETDATETAAANEAAAAESSGSWITAAGQQIAAAAGWVAQSAGKVAAVIASNVAGAATTAGAWIAGAASQVASAAIWVAQGIAKVAVMVGANVAGAATTAAAWVIANAAMLLGIGLVIAAVAVAVLLIVKNWSKISDAAKIAFHAVLTVVDSVISWVKANWPLLLAILMGPIAVAALEIGKHWKQIKDGASDLLGDLIRFFTGLPGKIWSALGDLGSMMFKAGKSAISMLISGLKSIPVIGTMVSIAGDIADHFPHSPAKRGPLSGSGSPDVAGRNIPRMLAQGIAAGTPQATAAALALASRVQAATSGLSARGGTPGIASSLAASAIGPASGSGGGNAYITVDMRGAHLMTDADMTAFVNKMGPALNKALAQAGRKINIRG